MCFSSFAMCVLAGTQLCCCYWSFFFGTHAAMEVSRPLHNGLVTNKHHESVDIHGHIILHQSHSDRPRCDLASLLRRFLSRSTLSDWAKTAGGCQQSLWGSRPRSPALKKNSQQRESFASSHKKSFRYQWAIMRTFCVSLLCLVWGRRFPGLHFTLNCTW